VNKIAEATFDFSDMSGGINSVDNSYSISSNQVVSSINAIHERTGIKRAKGYQGLRSTAQFAGSCQGMDIHTSIAGTETICAVSGGDVYAVTTLGVPTKILDGAGTAQAVMANYLGKLWGCDGTSVWKVESSTTAYRVGIEPPTGATAAAQAGGSLAAGVYAVYCSYARKESGSNVLYSYPQSLGNVTTSGGNLTVRVTLANSADPQVNNKVIWMTDAGGAVVYFYYETGNNTTTTIDVTSNASKNTSVLMTSWATPSSIPPAFVHLTAYDGRLWGFTANSNVLYYSMRQTSIDFAYDLERFYNPSDPVTGNRIPFPYKIQATWGQAGNLYVSTVGGIFVMRGCDTFLRPEHIERRLYIPFLCAKTLKENNGLFFCVTNDGVRYFDGESFSPDLSWTIKPHIDVLYAGLSADYPACAEIYRRQAKRTEYIVSYRDTAISTTNNNRSIVLNIDSMVRTGQDTATGSWEQRDLGFCDIKTSAGGTLYLAQSVGSSGLICFENQYYDKWVYNASGSFLTDETAKLFYIKTRTVVGDIMAVIRLLGRVVLAKGYEPFSIKIQFDDDNNPNVTTQATTSLGSPIVLSPFVLLPFVLPYENPTVDNDSLGDQLSGRMFHLEISQTGKDSALDIVKILVYGWTERNYNT
jgi:hypothetical protein